MALFTVIAEYRGGTYIDQIRGFSASAALRKLTKKGRSSLPKAIVSGMKQLIAEGDRPVTIGGCKNVWCTSESYGSGLLLINIVETAEQNTRKRNHSTV